MRPEGLRPAFPSLPPPGPQALPSSLGAHTGVQPAVPSPQAQAQPPPPRTALLTPLPASVGEKQRKERLSPTAAGGAFEKGRAATPPPQEK